MKRKINKFIFVHIPKTAGTTFIRILESLYAGKTGRDYKNNKRKKGNYVSEIGVETCDVIYGHFNSEKYKSLGRPQITFLRDPVERIISEYFYTKNNAKNILDYIDNKEKYGRKEVKSKNVIYDYVIDLSNFDLVLLQDHFDESLSRFEKWSGMTVPKNYKSRKINKKKGFIRDDIKLKIKNRLAKDYEIYNEALINWGKNEDI